MSQPRLSCYSISPSVVLGVTAHLDASVHRWSGESLQHFLDITKRVCRYIYTYTSEYTCVFEYVHVYVHVYVYVRMYMYMYIYV